MHDHFHDQDHGPHPVWEELTSHLPFSVGAVIVSLSALTLINLVFRVEDHQSMERMFHVSHAIHVLLAATGTTAMYLIYGGKRLPAVTIGLLGSVPICTLSDIVFPWLGGRLLGHAMEFHICAIHEPFLIWPCAGLGVATGLFSAGYVQRLTIYSHSGHVFVSSFASAIYLLSYVQNWWAEFGWILLIVTLAVMVPCTASDIILPLLFAKQRRRRHPEVDEETDILKRRH